MAEVRALDEETVSRIAAGEVIARPASVVKELVENSLDAGATRITVRVEGGGIDAIRVTDDGHGMSAADAVRAFDRHTTSKLAGVEGVKSVDTLGFRGEALPSIAAVADVTLTTKAEGEDAVEVRVEDDERETRPAGHRVGTTVEARELFSKVPARRKALAGPKAEFRRVSETVSRYALVRPDVSFRLEHGERTVLTPRGSGDFAYALLGVYDREVAGQSVAVEGGDGPVAVRGRVTTPAVTRSKPDHLRVAVNGRAVLNSALRDAAIAGYGNLLPDGRYPVGAIDVALPPERVDANVHPRKERVAFRGTDVAGAVESAVGEALATADLTRAAETALDLDDSLEAVSGGDAFEGVSVIGQFRDAYLLCERDEELLVLDQHAAHERVNYERLRAAVGEIPSAEVDPPATLSLSPGAAATLEAERQRVRELGYRVSPFGGNAYRVSAVPAPLGRTAAPESLQDVLDELADGEAEDPRDAALAELACHPSLKAGDALDAETSETLLSELGACEQPYACPHGRPTVLSIEEKSLVSGFERSNRRVG